MNNNKGFTLLTTLFIVIGIIAVGGGIWYFTSQSLDTVPQQVVKIKDCADNTDCLIVAVKDNCSLASGKYNFENIGEKATGDEINFLIPGTSLVIHADYEIRGQGTAGKCSIYKTESSEIKLTDAFIKDRLANGYTVQKVRYTMQTLTEATNQMNNFVAIPEKSDGVCNFSAEDLSLDMKQLKAGNISRSIATDGEKIRDVCTNYFKN